MTLILRLGMKSCCLQTCCRMVVPGFTIAMLDTDLKINP